MSTLPTEAPLRTPEALLAAWRERRAAGRQRRARLGMEGFVMLLALLRDEPLHVRRLQEAAGIGHTAAYRFLLSMHGLQRLHIAHWKAEPGRALAPCFAFGPGTDAAPPGARPNGRRVEGTRLPLPRVNPSLIALETLLRALEEPASRQELQQATGLDIDTVRETVDAPVATGLAHVPLWQWRDQGGAPVPQYQLGPGRNAPMPRVRPKQRRELLRERGRGRRFAQLDAVMASLARRPAAEGVA